MGYKLPGTKDLKWWFMRELGVTTIKRIFWEAKQCVDKLAKEAVLLPEGLHVYVTMPLLSQLLDDDVLLLDGNHCIWTAGMLDKQMVMVPSKLDQTLLQRLQMSWPDVQNGNNDWFWSHEWEDHGVYSLSSYNQRAYFTLAVDLKDRYDILWHLTSVNFKPGGTYKDEASIENAIMSCTTKTPELVCTPRSANTKSLLEVRICFDSNLAVMDCPGKSLSKDKACSQTNIFLPK